MKIFIAQDDGSKDFSKLFTITEDIVVCTTRQYPILSGQDEHLAEIQDKMRCFNHDQDSIVLVGDPVNIGIVLAIALQKGGDIRLLKWDRFQFDYVTVKLINFKEKENENGKVNENEKRVRSCSAA